MVADLHLPRGKAEAVSLVTVLALLLPGCASWPWGAATSTPSSNSSAPQATLPSPPPIASNSEPAPQPSVFPRNEIMSAYIDRIKRKIRSHLKFTDTNKNYATMFRVKLKQDMSIISVKVVRSSGNPSYDAAALAAIKKTGSYPPLPDGLEFAPFASHKINYKLHDSPNT